MSLAYTYNYILVTTVFLLILYTSQTYFHTYTEITISSYSQVSHEYDNIHSLISTDQNQREFSRVPSFVVCKTMYEILYGEANLPCHIRRNDLHIHLPTHWIHIIVRNNLFKPNDRLDWCAGFQRN